MSIRIGINGFGRMGRLALRAAWNWPEFEIVHINEIKGGAETAAHLLEFDPVHGRWNREVGFGEDTVRVGDRAISFSAFGTPGEVPWDAHGVDIVIEASGRFRTPELLQPYFERGVKKVIVAAPVKPGAGGEHVADPHHHRLSDRHHADLS
jgi:glyceraldehyde 3-phosphate dehydrogenase